MMWGLRRWRGWRLRCCASVFSSRHPSVDKISLTLNRDERPQLGGSRRLTDYFFQRLMDDSQIRHALEMFDTASSNLQEAAWASLRPLGVDVVPFLAEYFPRTKKAQGRVALIFHAIRYARESQAAFLGLLALNDKATLVRYRACGLCAYSLKADAIPHLKRLLKHTDAKTVADAEAAIDAIRCKNHRYFIDRTHSHSTFWEVNPTDVSY